MYSDQVQVNGSLDYSVYESVSFHGRNVDVRIIMLNCVIMRTKNVLHEVVKNEDILFLHVSLLHVIHFFVSLSAYIIDNIVARCILDFLFFPHWHSLYHATAAIHYLC